VFCSLRCRIRAELYEFFIRFPRSLILWMTLKCKKRHHEVSFSGDVVMNRLL
jgi:hypothetical protein